MPKLFRDKGKYSYTDKYKRNGDYHYDVVDTEKFNVSSPSPGDVDEEDQDKPMREDELQGPTKWMSKNVFEPSLSEKDSLSKSHASRNIADKIHGNNDSNNLEIINQKLLTTDITGQQSPMKTLTTENTLMKNFIKKSMGKTFKSYTRQSNQVKGRKKTQREKCKFHISSNKI